MKKLVLLIGLFLILTPWMMGQWTSPGNGTSYTLRDLVEVSGGCVTYLENQRSYLLQADLTVAPNDQLTVVPEDFEMIDADAGGILCHGNALITIKGGITIDCGDAIDVYVEPDTVSHLRIVLDHTTAPSLFAHTKFYYLSGIQVIESDVTFDDCMFQSFDKDHIKGAVQYENCDPVFNNCIFQGNYGSAIACTEGGSGSPQINRCEFRYNVLSKENMPQLDFGPGGGDTIRLINSRVVGLYPLVGGISIKGMDEVHDTKILIQGNFIADNRYGYWQQGGSIDGILKDNEIVCNQIAPSPVEDGFGVRIEDMGRATLRHNLIHSNLWGVFVVGKAVLDMGTADDTGRNILYNNHNSSSGEDVEYALYVEGENDINAVGNFWGGDNEAFAENVIYHRPDLGEDHGLVIYTPILTKNDWNVEEQYSEAIKVYPNPTEGQVNLQVDKAQSFDYELFNINGQRMMSGHAEGTSTVIDMEPYPQGIYLISVKTDHQTKPIYQRIIR